MVVEEGTAQPLAVVFVWVHDREGVSLALIETDETGRFAATLPRAGAYALRVHKFGYQPLETEHFEVANDEELELHIVIAVQAIALDPLEVTATRGIAPGTHPDFQRRIAWGRQTGSGRFFTRDDIENAGLLRTTSLLMTVPAVPLRYTRDGRVLLAASMRGSPSCRPAVYMNGAEVSNLAGLDDLVTLEELEGVEIYRWRNEMPTELAWGDVCSAVAFWTRSRHQPPGRIAFWRRLVVAGGLVAGALLAGALVH